MEEKANPEQSIYVRCRCVFICRPTLHIHNPDLLGSHLLLVAIYGEIGPQEKAHAEAKEIIRLSLDFFLFL